MHRLLSRRAAARGAAVRRAKSDGPEAPAGDGAAAPAATPPRDAAATADRIERMLRAQRGKETDYAPPAVKGGGDVAAAQEGGAVMGVEEPVRDAAHIKVDTAAALRGKRADAVAAWYKESRKSSGGDLSTIIRQKALFESAEYETVEEQSQAIDRMWIAFQALMLVLLLSLGAKVWSYSGRRYFHELLDEMREEFKMDEVEPTEGIRQEEVWKQYGWYFKWKDALYSKHRSERQAEVARPYEGSTMDATDTWMRSRFRYYNTWDWLTGNA